MNDKPVLAELEVVHPDCWCVDVTKKNEGIIECINWITNKKDFKKNKVFCRFQSSKLNKFIKTISKHRNVIKVNIVQKGKNSAKAYVTTKHEPSVTRGIWESECILLRPVSTEKGIDRAVVLAPTEKHFRNLLELYGKKMFNTKIAMRKSLNKIDKLSLDVFYKSGFLKIREMQKSLSNRQKQVFELASRKGYYEYPRRLTLADLANEIGIGESTLRSHLRLAEAKMLPIISNMMNGAQ